MEVPPFYFLERKTMKLPNEIIRSYEPTMGQLDITGAGDIEIKVRNDKKVIWVNIDGLCVLRVCRIKGKVVVECPEELIFRDGD